MNEYSGYVDYEQMDNIDKMKTIFKKKFNPSLIQSIQKLGTHMHDVYTNGISFGVDSLTDKEQYDHVVQYAYHLNKSLQGIEKLEKIINRITTKRKLTEKEQEWFDRHVKWVIRDGYYTYPRKFTGFLSD